MAARVGFEPATSADKVDDIVHAHQCVVFTVPQCPFCHRVVLLLKSLGVTPHEQDVSGDTDLMKAVVARTNMDTFPSVWANGEFVGGCDDSCAMADDGTLQRMLCLPTHNATLPDGERPPPRGVGLFLFPTVANRWVVQSIGLQVTTLCILAIVYRENSWAHWLTFGLAVDYGIRFVFGGTASVLGSTGLFFTAGLEESLMPGIPKQFATFIGFFMSSVATLLFLASTDDNTPHIGGPVVLGTLAFFAFLEGAFNFCAGCVFFGLGVRFGIFNKLVYQPYTDLIKMVAYQVKFANTRLGWGKLSTLEPYFTDGGLTRVVGDKDLLGWKRKIDDEYCPEPHMVQSAKYKDGLSTAIDIKYKFPKTVDETRRESWSARHVEFGNFAIPLGLAGLALVYKELHSDATPLIHAPVQIFKFLAIMSFAVYGLLTLCMVYKLLRYPHKIWNDLLNPMKKPVATTIFLNWLLYCYLLEGEDGRMDGAQSFCFWAGAPATMLHFLWCVYGWVAHKHDTNHVAPTMLFPAGAVLVVALVAPLQNYHELARWCFGAGMLMAIVLFTTTFAHGITHHWSDPRQRLTVALWMAVCFIAQLAYRATFGSLNDGFDVVEFTFFAGGVLFFLAGVLMVYPGRFLLCGPFDMGNWNVAFPLDVFAAATIGYYRVYKHDFSRGVMFVAVIFATYANFCLVFHTLHKLVQRKWPTAPPKWGPQSITRLQHEAFRTMVGIMVKDARQECKGEAQHAAQLQRLKGRFAEFHQLYRVHAKIEDDVIFDEIKGFHAEQLDVFHQQHHDLEEALAQCVAAAAAGDLDKLRAAVEAVADPFLDHIQAEEDHLVAIIRKQMNLRMQENMLRRVWGLVDVEDWQASMTTVVRYLQRQDQREQYVRCWCWAMQERCQQFGFWLYRGLALDPVGDMKYAQLLQCMPEIAPRGSGFDYVKYV